MIDRKKRNTLKAMSVAAGTAAAATTGGAVAAGMNEVLITGTAGPQQDAALATFDVRTRVSVERNDIEVVLTNTGSEPATITQMTPSVTRVARGEFNFSALLNDGSLTINTGESVSVPLTRKPVKLWSASGNSNSLSSNLKKTMSIVTDGSAFASLNIADAMAVA